MQALTEAEILLMKDQKGQNGSFYTALLNAIYVADTENRAKLSKGFPELVEAVRRYRNEPGYFEDLCRRWNASNPTEQIKP